MSKLCFIIEFGEKFPECKNIKKLDGRKNCAIPDVASFSLLVCFEKRELWLSEELSYLFCGFF